MQQILTVLFRQDISRRDWRHAQRNQWRGNPWRLCRLCRLCIWCFSIRIVHKLSFFLQKQRWCLRFPAKCSKISKIFLRKKSNASTKRSWQCSVEILLRQGTLFDLVFLFSLNISDYLRSKRLQKMARWLVGLTQRKQHLTLMEVLMEAYRHMQRSLLLASPSATLVNRASAAALFAVIASPGPPLSGPSEEHYL